MSDGYIIRSGENLDITYIENILAQYEVLLEEIELVSVFRSMLNL